MSEELENYLASLERCDKFRSVKTLKSSPHETTEIVELVDGGTVSGPFIRKRISTESGIGHAYERLFAEQRATRHIGPVPAIYECFATEDSLIVVMEYVRGKTLADWVYESDPSPAFAAHVFPRICDAVSELHESFEPPIIHRDLKPSNVMISSAGVKIIDFGIARTYRTGAETDTKRFGTPSYAPPEQFGFGQTDERSDVYALGMLLYYCLTERTPSFSTMDAEFDEDGVPEALRKVIAKAAAFDPAARYASAAQLKEAFLAAIDKVFTPTWAPPSSAPSMLANAGEAAGPWKPPTGMAAIPDATPSRKHANLTDALFSRIHIPEAIGITWNVIVFLTWMLMIIGCFVAAADPNEQNLAYPLAVRVVVYPILLGLAFTFLGLAVMDKRLFWKLFPRLPRLSGGVAFGAFFAAAMMALALAVVVYSIAGSMLQT